VRPAAQGCELRAIADAPVDGGDARPLAAPEDVELASHLEAELAGGDDDEREDRVRIDPDPLEERKGERTGLAGAGLSLGENVATLTKEGDGPFLDLGELDPAKPFDGQVELGM
jgi:hypothetical protein